MPGMLKLDEFASHILSVFGGKVALVGSSVKSKQWRDVDIRLLLSDEQYVRVFRLDPSAYDPAQYMDGCDFVERAAQDHWNRDVHKCGIWVGLVLAFSALGREMTGLPIDFQIMPESIADLIHPVKALDESDTRGSNPRYFIGYTPLRYKLDVQV